MIGTVLKILIVLAILNAMARASMVAWTYYQFRDEAQQLVLFGGGVSTAKLEEQVLVKASELEVPIEAQEVDVYREGNQTFITASYTHPVELFPTVEYPVALSFTVDAVDLKREP